MTGSAVEVPEAKMNLYDGKTAEHIQSDIKIVDHEITGTLLHVTGFTAFGEGEQEGNFLALSLGAKEDVEITTGLINGKHGLTKVTDGFCVYRIENKDTQKVQVIFKKDDVVETKVYGLTGLTCNTQ